MFHIIGNDIFLSRGDTAGIAVKIREANDGEYYRMEETDTLRLTVKRSTESTAPVIEKTEPVEETETVAGNTIYTYRFDITTADTKDLDFGDYVYDVRLDFGIGNRSTIVEPSLFKIERVVSNPNE